MSDEATADGDLAAHVSTYASFLKLAEVLSVGVAAILFILGVWGIKGHGGWALLMLILDVAGMAAGAMSSMGWRAVAPAFVLSFLLFVFL
ncbi:MAG: aa3-type cytochrome c oxidase subunit IV [Hyphomicrobiales bacterium]|nr:aa3-type cytochrome c oxidase subunit IV [Hyphomicrobiales bacterium]